MKTCSLTYLENNKQSCQQANESASSFRSLGWEVHLTRGLTPQTYPISDYKVMSGSRLMSFYFENQKKYATKRACVMNHVRFWERVVAADEPLVFLEHDAIAVSAPVDWQFEEVLVLNAEYAFDFGALRGKFRGWKIPTVEEVSPLPEDYPLLCRVKDSPYFGAKMICGTAAYAITPKGARAMLTVVEERGLEQSDYIINDMNVVIEYVCPSPVKFNSKNLGTSHG
jgi:GR25 family glycosyltransferase involved in LPS biosynthesis